MPNNYLDDDMSEGTYLSNFLDDMAGDEDDYDTYRSRITVNPSTAVDRYNIIKAAPKGTRCTCPGCGKIITKNAYNTIFCSNKGPHNCKDRFWTSVRPERRERADYWGKRGRSYLYR